MSRRKGAREPADSTCELQGSTVPEGTAARGPRVEAASREMGRGEVRPWPHWAQASSMFVSLAIKVKKCHVLVKREV